MSWCFDELRDDDDDNDDDDDYKDDGNDEDEGDEVGVTLVAGKVFYSWQVIRLTNLHSRGGDAGFIKWYKVALAANFITGLISVVLGCFGTLILKAVPPAALLVPISGIILIGVILGWATGLNKSADVVGASKLVKWCGPV